MARHVTSIGRMHAMVVMVNDEVPNWRTLNSWRCQILATAPTISLLLVHVVGEAAQGIVGEYLARLTETRHGHRYMSSIAINDELIGIIIIQKVGTSEFAVSQLLRCRWAFFVLVALADARNGQ